MPSDTVGLIGSGGRVTPISVEIADTSNEINYGLMFRQSLPRYSGMLFVFSNGNGYHYFHMTNTYIPLDMLFIDSDLTIVNICENAEPLSDTLIPSGAPCKYVLEVNGGLCSELGVRAGGKVILGRIIPSGPGPAPAPTATPAPAPTPAPTPIPPKKDPDVVYYQPTATPVPASTPAVQANQTPTTAPTATPDSNVTILPDLRSPFWGHGSFANLRQSGQSLALDNPDPAATAMPTPGPAASSPGIAPTGIRLSVFFDIFAAFIGIFLTVVVNRMIKL